MKRLPVLPALSCVPDCGECCTVVPITETEAGRIERFAEARGLKPLAQGPRCPWYQGGGCAVYEVRPLICRLFGHAPKLPCSYFPERANDLRDAELDALIRANGPARHVTHGRLERGALPDLLAALRDGRDNANATSMRFAMRTLDRAAGGAL